MTSSHARLEDCRERRAGAGLHAGVDVDLLGPDQRPAGAGLHAGVDEAADRLEAGELVVHPTEAVYGIGGLLEDRPLAALRRMKDRPRDGFVVLAPSAESVRDALTKAGRTLARAFWPGPLTLVVDDPQDRFHPAAKAPDGSVALRVPGHPVARALLARAGRPVTSTSANRPGEPPAATADDARRAALAMGGEAFVLDAGPLPGGAPSTLVRLPPGDGAPVVLREGPVRAEAVRAALRGGAP